MRYKNTFGNHYVGIKLSTNSKRIYKLIENVLDLDNSFRCSRSKIKIRFYLNETTLENQNSEKKFVYQSQLEKKKTLLSSFGKRIVSVTTDLKANVARGTIADYKESHKERLLDFMLMKPLRFILKHHGLFFLHSSAVCKDRDCLLISGSQNSGKSTLALVLAQNGFNLLADDDCFIKLVRNQPQLFPFPTKMGLNDRILKRYPELIKHTLKNYRYGRKRRISLSSISNSNATKALRCRMIIFPRYQAKGKICLKEMPKEEVLRRLGKDSPMVYSKKQAQRMFWTLYSLAKTANSFELIYNDDKLNEVPQLVNKRFQSKDGSLILT